MYCVHHNTQLLVLVGVDIIETNTYQASILGFKKYLGVSEDEAFNLIRKAVSLAKEAIFECAKLGKYLKK